MVCPSSLLRCAANRNYTLAAPNSLRPVVGLEQLATWLMKQCARQQIDQAAITQPATTAPRVQRQLQISQEVGQDSSWI